MQPSKRKKYKCTNRIFLLESWAFRRFVIIIQMYKMFRKLFISTHCFFSLGKTRQRNASPDSKHPMWTFVSFRLLFTFGDKFQFTFNILDLRQVDNRSWKFLHSRNWLLFLWGGRSSLLSFRSTLFPSGRLPSSRTKGSHWNIDIRLDGSDVGNWLLRHIHKVLALCSAPEAGCCGLKLNLWSVLAVTRAATRFCRGNHSPWWQLGLGILSQLCEYIFSQQPLKTFGDSLKSRVL